MGFDPDLAAGQFLYPLGPVFEGLVADGAGLPGTLDPHPDTILGAADCRCAENRTARAERRALLQKTAPGRTDVPVLLRFLVETVVFLVFHVLHLQIGRDMPSGNGRTRPPFSGRPHVEIPFPNGCWQRPRGVSIVGRRAAGRRENGCIIVVPAALLRELYCPCIGDLSRTVCRMGLGAHPSPSRTNHRAQLHCLSEQFRVGKSVWLGGKNCTAVPAGSGGALPRRKAFRFRAHRSQADGGSAG